MANLSDGEIEITLCGEPRILKPTLNAMKALSRMHNGLAGVRAQLAQQDVDAVCSVLRQGLGLTDKDMKALEQKVWKNGLTPTLIIALINYVAILANGGRSLEDDAGAEDETGGAEGNG